jgi:hypothetical protein
MDTITYRKRCKKCNTDLIQNAKYCYNCGSDDLVTVKVIHKNAYQQSYQQHSYNYQQCNDVDDGSFAGGFLLGFLLGILGLILGLCITRKNTKDGAIKGFCCRLACYVVFGLMYVGIFVAK